MHSQIVINPRFHRGTKIGNGRPVLAAKIGPGGDQFWWGTDFFVTVLLWRYYRRANAYINMAMGKSSSQH